MIRKILSSFKMAVSTIYGHFFHTILSILGMVIGVAALVAILCLIDGMEKFAKEQINTTTSLNSIIISSHPTKNVNGIVVKKDSFAYINYSQFKRIQQSLAKPSASYLLNSQSIEIGLDGKRKKVASVLLGSSEYLKPGTEIKSGRALDSTDLKNASFVAVVNNLFADGLIASDSSNYLIGRNLNLNGHLIRVVGIIDDGSKKPQLFLPVTIFSHAELKSYLPTMVIEAENIEDIESIKLTLSAQLKKEFGDHASDLEIMTNGFRLQQAERGFRLFRVIMGLIVGISVVVGGIGVMNVLLISVTQRTSEIGVRKAVGAKRKDILLQFLTESITISSFGSFCGLLLGIFGTMGAIPIIRALTKIPFQASYTWNTIAVVAILALLVGIVFGTYPAVRASRLDPVEAMRRE
jgi:putative ABC transport system permease protein